MSKALQEDLPIETHALAPPHRESTIKVNGERKWMGQFPPSASLMSAAFGRTIAGVEGRISQKQNGLPFLYFLNRPKQSIRN